MTISKLSVIKFIEKKISTFKKNRRKKPLTFAELREYFRPPVGYSHFFLKVKSDFIFITIILILYLIFDNSFSSNDFLKFSRDFYSFKLWSFSESLGIILSLLSVLLMTLSKRFLFMTLISYKLNLITKMVVEYTYRIGMWSIIFFSESLIISIFITQPSLSTIGLYVLCVIVVVGFLCLNFFFWWLDFYR